MKCNFGNGRGGVLMKIIKNGSEKFIRRKERKEKRERERAEAKQRALEIVTFKCDNCGCKFSADRDEYFIHWGLGGDCSVVEIDCPYCSTVLTKKLSVKLRTTRDDVKRMNKRNTERYGVCYRNDI